jgi:ABC-type multidrug transport system ATPase subunit
LSAPVASLGWEQAFAPPALRSVVAHQLTRSHGDVHALFRASFTLQPGQVTLVLGPNGAGKSTLVQLLSTLSRPTDGTLKFDGADAWNHRLRVRPLIGLVSHEALVHGELTARENLRYTAQLHLRTPEPDVSDWLQRVGLTEAADRPVATYSRGMRQRLSLARALLTSPSLVLFDEPLTGLDRSGQAFVWDVIGALRAAGRMVVVVTHDFDAPRDAVDQVLVLTRGRIRFQGPPEFPLHALYDEVLSGSRAVARVVSAVPDPAIAPAVESA